MTAQEDRDRVVQLAGVVEEVLRRLKAAAVPKSSMTRYILPTPINGSVVDRWREVLEECRGPAVADAHYGPPAASQSDERGWFVFWDADDPATAWSTGQGVLYPAGDEPEAAAREHLDALRAAKLGPAGLARVERPGLVFEVVRPRESKVTVGSRLSLRAASGA